MASVKGKKNRIYTDIDLSFGVNAFSGDINKKLDVNAVKQSIKNLLLTQSGEKPFHPEIGSPLYGLLFENMRPGMETVISSRIQDVVTAFEPRCKMKVVETQADYDKNTYNVSMFFHVVGVNEPQSMHMELKRLR